MGIAFGSGYQFGVVNQIPRNSQFEWIANAETHLSCKSENFEKKVAIGKGKFGLVFLAQHKPSAKYVAIKFVSKQAIYDSQKIEKFQQEINVLQLIHHPFLMHCFGGFETPSCIALICEFAYGGELYHRLKQKVKFSEQEAKFYFCEVASAINYLHNNLQLVYRDLKPENILIDNTGHIKICDFGFTAPCNEDENDLRDGCGTAMYIAPEIAGGFMKGSHGFPVDWWALGCVLYEMIAGEAPFGDSDALTKFEIFNNITEKNVLYPLRMSLSVKQLLKGLLDKKQSTRFAWQQVSASSWLQDVNWSAVEERKVKPPWIPEISSNVNHTAHFLKWDLELPNTAPSGSVQSYVSALRLPPPTSKELLTSNISTRSMPQLKHDRSQASLQHQFSIAKLSGIEKQESNAKLINPTPSLKRKKSSFDPISTNELGETVSPSEKLKHRGPSGRLQRGESHAGMALQRNHSRMSSSKLQVHPR